MSKKKSRYNCETCPAYCCSYVRIEVKDKDIERLAQHHGISFEKARKKFSRKGYEKGERILRHRKDEHYGTVCRFLDRETRMCTVHVARPTICREFPGLSRCGYYDFLTFERRAQEDKEHVATTYNV